MSQNVLSLFSGAGGAVEGFKQAGYNVVAAVDFNEDCVATLKENHPTTLAIREDLNETSPSEFAEKYNVPKESIDVVVGGPPCQGFSVVTGSDKSDERNNRVVDFIEYVSFYKPDVCLMENVSGILSMEDGEVVNNIIQEFKNLDYNMSVDKHNAADYGVPQSRKRVLFVGKYDDISTTNKSENKEKTVSDALSKVNEQHPNHNISNLADKTVEKIKNTKQGEEIYESFGIQKKLNPNKPAPTLVASGWQFAHPTEPRSLTIHERALLQSFPRDYVFKGNKTPKYHQTGNAVPPKMIKKVAEKL